MILSSESSSCCFAGWLRLLDAMSFASLSLSLLYVAKLHGGGRRP